MRIEVMIFQPAEVSKWDFNHKKQLQKKLAGVIQVDWVNHELARHSLRCQITVIAAVKYYGHFYDLGLEQGYIAKHQKWYRKCSYNVSFGWFWQS